MEEQEINLKTKYEQKEIQKKKMKKLKKQKKFKKEIIL